MSPLRPSVCESVLPVVARNEKSIVPSRNGGGVSLGAATGGRAAGAGAWAAANIGRTRVSAAAISVCRNMVSHSASVES